MIKQLAYSAVLALGMIAGCNSQKHSPATAASPSTAVAGAVSGPFSPQELQQFAGLDPIDTHTHVHRGDAALYALLNRLNLHTVNIVLTNDQDPEEKDLAAESQGAWKAIHESNGRMVLCTSIDPYKFSQPGFAASSIKAINHEFSQGAVAVKIWKNIGLEIKDAKGNYILPDNPVFAPIYRDIAGQHKTLIAHVADPNSAWEAPNPDSPDYAYFNAHPFWYMYGKPGVPAKQKILDARDHIIESNPTLRVVGAHLGSMESNFQQLGEHLDRYPNFAVDLAARMPYFMRQPRADMIAFITKYQDRLIYATDLVLAAKDDPAPTVKKWEEEYARDWRYLATNDTLDYKGHAAEGLALPTPILRKLYHDNAIHWFPGVIPDSY